MYTQPQGYKTNGQLKECDVCGFAHKRFKELKLQNGLWKCPQDLDREDRRRSR